jgi:thiol-disulfide isomerase/thioredoxin
MGMIFDGGFSFSGFERDKAWLRDGERYLDVSMVSGIDDENDGRALVLADFDDDGDRDLFVHDIQRERHHLYRNDAPTATGRSSVKLLLRATSGPAEAMGAIVRATVEGMTTAQVLAYGSGFLSQNAPELVFGVGAAAAADEVVVRWPGRAVESFGRLAAGKTWLLEEGSGLAVERPRRPFEFADPAPPGLLVEIGATLDDLAVVDADGESGTLRFARGGQPLLVNVWATTCALCVAELGDLQKIADAGEFSVVLVGLDPPADRERARKQLAKAGVTTETWWLDASEFGVLFDARRLPLPTTLVLSPDGRLVDVLQMPITEWRR